MVDEPGGIRTLDLRLTFRAAESLKTPQSRLEGRRLIQTGPRAPYMGIHFVIAQPYLNVFSQVCHYRPLKNTTFIYDILFKTVITLVLLGGVRKNIR